MHFHGIFGGLHKIGDWIIRFIALNVLWVLFSFLGLIIFGLYPGTIAMFTVVRKWIRGDHDISIIGTFWDSYRANFIKANLIGLIQFTITIILYIDYLFLNTLAGWLAILLNIILINALILFCVSVLFIFPVFVHYQLKLIQYFKMSIIIGISYPFQTILILLCTILICSIVYILPGFLLFFGSVLSFLIMTIANNAFTKIEIKNQQVN